MSVTSAGAGEIAANNGNEHESIVSWGCEIADEWLTRGARNEIHICDSNMNGSSEREAISRRYADNETIISWILSLSLRMTTNSFCFGLIVLTTFILDTTLVP